MNIMGTNVELNTRVIVALSKQGCKENEKLIADLRLQNISILMSVEMLKEYKEGKSVQKMGEDYCKRVEAGDPSIILVSEAERLGVDFGDITAKEKRKEERSVKRIPQMAEKRNGKRVKKRHHHQ